VWLKAARALLGPPGPKSFEYISMLYYI
jgi:hypothetical protein